MKLSEIQVDGYEKVMRCEDQASGLHALIAVHETALGRGCGGLRMLPYANEEEALFDVLRLARSMTYKSAVAETGLGGGKAVILADPATDKSPELYRAMGRFIDSFEGQYATAADMNTTVADLEIVAETTRWVTCLPQERGGSGDPSPYTARGCLQSMRAVLRELEGSDELAGKSVLIQGVGAVGGRLARMLAERGAELILCDVDEAKVGELAAELGARQVPNDGHEALECDIYAPCARGAGLDDETIPRLRCRAVAGAANNQLLEPHHADALRARGILYAPDYVVNAGGIINIGVELLPEGYDEAVSFQRVDRIYDNLLSVFEIARTEDISTQEASARLGDRRIEAARAARA